MDQTGNLTREKLAESSGSEGQRAPEHEKTLEAREVKTKAHEVLKTPEGAVEGTLGVELNEGKIAEDINEDKAFAPLAGGKSYTADEIDAIRAKLLAALPPQEIMVKQIRLKLVRQEKKLTKQMGRLKKHAHRKAYELSIVVAQLRKIREFFALLAHATFEMIKHLWLKIVHGV